MKVSGRFTYANVVSTLCLVLIIAGGGGAAYALGKNTVGSPQIINKSIKAKDLGKKSVRKGKIARDAVVSGKVKNGSLGATDLNGKTRSGLAEAGMNIAADGTMNRWFNRRGGKPAVVSHFPGAYWISVPGTAATGTSVIAVANSGLSGTHCEMNDIDADGLFVVVCRNKDGNVTDTNFQLIVFRS